jgi:polyferredoxin
LNNIENPNLAGYDLYASTFKNIFSFSLIVLIITIIILTISFFVYRFWCNYFCPIGTVSDLILKIEKKFNK